MKRSSVWDRQQVVVLFPLTTQWFDATAGVDVAIGDFDIAIFVILVDLH